MGREKKIPIFLLINKTVFFNFKLLDQFCGEYLYATFQRYLK